MKYFILVLICLSGLTGFSQEKKRSVAVLELVSSGELKKSEIVTLTKRFRDMLVQTDVFNVLERDKMDNILKEQDFILSDDCNSAECAVQVGQLLGVESVITGDIGKIGDTWTVSLRMVDMTTGKIEKTETMDYQGKIDGILDVMRQIAFVFSGKQPPKSKTTLIVQDYNSVNQGRILIETTVFAPVLKNMTFDNKSWHNSDNKVMFNEGGGELSICYMVTPKLKIGFSGKADFYNYKDSIMISSTQIFPSPQLATPKIFSIGPKIGYYFSTGTIKPFIDLSFGYFILSPDFVKDSEIPAELEKRKDLKSESGVLADIAVGFDIRLWKYLDIRVAPRIMFTKTKPISGSGNLNVGFVFHAGKGFPVDEK